MLIHASRTRSRVGRTARPFGALILRPRQRPATIRKRDAGWGMRDATTEPRGSRRAKSNIGNPRLQIALAAIVVSLQSERDIDASSRLQMHRAIDQPPAKRFQRTGAGVESNLQAVRTDRSRRTLDADVPGQQNGSGISNSKRLEVPEKRFDFVVESFDGNFEVDSDLRHQIFRSQVLVRDLVEAGRELLNLIASDGHTRGCPVAAEAQ